jgi:hypothetical protein
MEKQESKKPLSNFPTATITTKYTQLWDTDSRGKAKPYLARISHYGVTGSMR